VIFKGANEKNLLRTQVVEALIIFWGKNDVDGIRPLIRLE